MYPPVRSLHPELCKAQFTLLFRVLLLGCKEKLTFTLCFYDLGNFNAGLIVGCGLQEAMCLSIMHLGPQGNIGLVKESSQTSFKGFAGALLRKSGAGIFLAKRYKNTKTGNLEAAGNFHHLGTPTKLY